MANIHQTGVEQLQAEAKGVRSGFAAVIADGSLNTKLDMTYAQFFELVVTTGSAELMQQLLAYGIEPPFHAATCDKAVMVGSLEMLQLLLSLRPPPPVSPNLPSMAAALGYIDILAWMRDQGLPAPWPAGPGLAMQALGFGQEEVFRWLVDEQACHMDREVSIKAVRLGRIHLLRHLNASSPRVHQITAAHARACAFRGDKEDLQWIMQYQHAHAVAGVMETAISASGSAGESEEDAFMRTSRISETSTQGAPPRCQHLQIIQWLVQAYPRAYWNEQHLCFVAARASALPILQHLRSLRPPCAWDAAAFRAGAAHGDHVMLRWLLQQRGTRSMKTVPPDCSDVRLLMLALGHGWCVPANMQPRLQQARGRHEAFWAAAGNPPQQRQPRTGLHHLPVDVLKRIACLADINFSWSMASC